jgi:hypothetical protein
VALAFYALRGAATVLAVRHRERRGKDRTPLHASAIGILPAIPRIRAMRTYIEAAESTSRVSSQQDAARSSVSRGSSLARNRSVASAGEFPFAVTERSSVPRAPLGTARGGARASAVHKLRLRAGAEFVGHGDMGDAPAITNEHHSRDGSAEPGKLPLSDKPGHAGPVPPGHRNRADRRNERGVDGAQNWGAAYAKPVSATALRLRIDPRRPVRATSEMSPTRSHDTARREDENDRPGGVSWRSETGAISQVSRARSSR